MARSSGAARRSRSWFRRTGEYVTKVAFAAVVIAGLGAVVGTIWIGSQVKEQTVVVDPYEEGLRYDAERRARGARREVALPAPPAAPGDATLAFAIADGDGRPLEGATVAVSVGRPDTSRGVTTVSARPDGAGRYAAEVELPAAGPWLLSSTCGVGGPGADREGRARRASLGERERRRSRQGALQCRSPAVAR